MIKSIEELLETEWMESFAQRYLERGFDYAERDRVRILRIEERSIHAECLGGGNNIYQQVIELIRHQGYDDVFYTCSCPVGDGCKHCAAVMFHLLWNPQVVEASSTRERLSTELENWIKQIPEPGSDPAATEKNPMSGCSTRLSTRTPGSGCWSCSRGVSLTMVP